jgi:hypothetical protein
MEETAYMIEGRPPSGMWLVPTAFVGMVAARALVGIAS